MIGAQTAHSEALGAVASQLEASKEESAVLKTSLEEAMENLSQLKQEFAAEQAKVLELEAQLGKLCSWAHLQ